MNLTIKFIILGLVVFILFTSWAAINILDIRFRYLELISPDPNIQSLVVSLIYVIIVGVFSAWLYLFKRE